MVRKKKPTLNPAARVVFLVVTLSVLIGGLVFVWKALPWSNLLLPPMTSAPAPIEATSTGFVLNQTSCEAAKGHWIDCGSPCHGKGAEVCIQMCEPQCLCGGIAGWQCPVSLVCTDYEPSSTTTDALGVCRAEASVVIPVVTTTTLPVIPEGMICDESHSICIHESFQNKLLENPISVTGTAVAFESRISWKLVDGTGNENELMSGSVSTNAPDMGVPGEFVIRDFFPRVPPTNDGYLNVFEASAKDGSPIHMISIPVRFPKMTWRSVKLYYLADTATEAQCKEVKAVASRIPSTLLPMEATLRHLLSIDSSDVAAGYRTRIPDRTQLLSITLNQGVVSLLFDEGLLRDGTEACRVEGIHAQIEQTVKQFAGVKTVEIKP